MRANVPPPFHRQSTGPFRRSAALHDRAGGLQQHEHLFLLQVQPMADGNYVQGHSLHPAAAFYHRVAMEARAEQEATGPDHLRHEHGQQGHDGEERSHHEDPHHSADHLPDHGVPAGHPGDTERALPERHPPVRLLEPGRDAGLVVVDQLQHLFHRLSIDLLSVPSDPKGLLGRSALPSVHSEARLYGSNHPYGHERRQVPRRSRRSPIGSHSAPLFVP